MEAALAADLRASSESFHPSARALVKRLLELPGEVRDAAERRAPHRITAYATETAQDFSAFYRDCRVVGAAEEGGDEDVRIAICVLTPSACSRRRSTCSGSRRRSRCSGAPLLGSLAARARLACSPPRRGAVDRYVPMRAPPAPPAGQVRPRLRPASSGRGRGHVLVLVPGTAAPAASSPVARDIVGACRIAGVDRRPARAGVRGHVGVRARATRSGRGLLPRLPVQARGCEDREVRGRLGARGGSSPTCAA